MAETLGSLCDKLTVVKLKQWHSTNEMRLESLASQQSQLVNEIDEFLVAAASGAIPAARLTFASNKVLPDATSPDATSPDATSPDATSPDATSPDATSPTTTPTPASLGDLLSLLAITNCALWHEQEKVYEFHKVPAPDKNAVVSRLATLNLERSTCIDAIDHTLLHLLAHCEVVDA